jgi:hypothetical protein
MKLHHLLEQEPDSFDEPPIGDDISDQIKHWDEVRQQVGAARHAAQASLRQFEKAHQIVPANGIIHQLHPTEYQVFDHDTQNSAGVQFRYSVAIPVDATPSPKQIFERWKKIYDKLQASNIQYDEMTSVAVRQRRTLQVQRINVAADRRRD